MQLYFSIDHTEKNKGQRWKMLIFFIHCIKDLHPKSFLFIQLLTSGSSLFSGYVHFLFEQVIYFLSSEIKILQKGIDREAPLLPPAPSAISLLVLVGIQFQQSLTYPLVFPWANAGKYEYIFLLSLLFTQVVAGNLTFSLTYICFIYHSIS